MNAPVYSTQGQKAKDISLGKAFSLPIRSDLIQRAVRAEASWDRQPYGTDPLAGKRTSAHYHGLRHYRWSMMNREMARMKRIHSQGYLNYTARFVPQARKGREAHPPLVEKIWTLKINKKEHELALLTAMAGAQRIIIEDSFQKLTKIKDVLIALQKVGVSPEEKKTVRAGRGKSRNRTYRKKSGVLIIVKEGRMPAPPGTEVRTLNELRVSDFAPGGRPGRMVVWTESSITEAGKL